MNLQLGRQHLPATKSRQTLFGRRASPPPPPPAPPPRGGCGKAKPCGRLLLAKSFITATDRSVEQYLSAQPSRSLPWHLRHAQSATKVVTNWHVLALGAWHAPGRGVTTFMLRRGSMCTKNMGCIAQRTWGACQLTSDSPQPVLQQFKVVCQLFD